jgi:biopolymer transport protein ExbD
MADNSTGKGGPADTDDEESPLNSTINTTPLVDVMLVMLIIFLITVPVVVAAKPVKLPDESTSHANEMKPDNINIIVDAEGNYYWNVYPRELSEIKRLMAERARVVPQPEVHISGDGSAYYGKVGDVVEAARIAGFIKVGFVTRPTNFGTQ